MADFASKQWVAGYLSSTNLKGDKGDAGPQGPKGDKGDTGEAGPQGPKGDTGAQGPQGIRGERGPQGEQGPPGADGQNGAGVPAGGAAGQVLSKIDGTDHHTQWKTLSAADVSAVSASGNETISGVKTFSSFPVTPSSAPTADYQVANKKYVDDHAGGGCSEEQMLSDATAALYGLTSAAVPDDVLAVLSQTVVQPPSGLPAPGGALDSYTWDEIKQIADAGKAAAYFSLGDTKTITYNGSSATVQIIGMSHDTCSSGKKAGITFILKTAVWGGYGTQYTVYKNSTFDTNAAAALSKFTSDVQAVMSFADKRYRSSCSGAGTEVISRKLFVPSYTEFSGCVPYAGTPTGTRYEYWASHAHGLSGNFFTGDPSSYSDWWTWWSGSFTTVGHANNYAGIYVAFCVGEVALSTPPFTDVLGNLITIPSAQLDSRVQIATGSYTGTGTYGSGNKKTLAFGFSADIVFISSAGHASYPAVGVLINPSPRGVCIQPANINATTNNVYGVEITEWSSTGVTFYGDAGQGQNTFNVSGLTYYYKAIRFG